MNNTTKGNPNTISAEDILCVNCAHMEKDWLWVFPFKPDDFYQCSFGGINKKIDPVTGKVGVSKETKSCKYMRSTFSDKNCGLEGKHWEPSEKWLHKKENLFKVLTK